MKNNLEILYKLNPKATFDQNPDWVFKHKPFWVYFYDSVLYWKLVNDKTNENQYNHFKTKC